MIQIVSSGDLGLDVLLGGGFRLVTRFEDRPSATVVVRGGPGAGKTLVGLHVALELARQLGGDVAIGCVEILPSEYRAQIESARPDIDAARVVELPGTAMSASGPRIFCGLLADLNPEAPDLVASLETLARDVIAANGKPTVLVVDSLIEGYGIGASIPRSSADAVMKLAAQGGYGLVLCEETQDVSASPWVFAADTVLEVGVEPRARGRWLEVRKHRFGESAPGHHELALGPKPTIYPEPRAWAMPAVDDLLRKTGWAKEPPSLPDLLWSSAFGADGGPTRGGFVFVASSLPDVARSLAYGLVPGTRRTLDLVLNLDPLIVEDAGGPSQNEVGVRIATVHGPARALRVMIEAVSRSSAEVRRVLLGDLNVVDTSWAEAIRMFATLVLDRTAAAPLIAYFSGETRARPEWAYADGRIEARHTQQATVTHRWTRDSRMVNFKSDVTKN